MLLVAAVLSKLSVGQLFVLEYILKAEFLALIVAFVQRETCHIIRTLQQFLLCT